MGLQFTFSVYGDVQISRELLRVGTFAADAYPVMSAIADDMMRVERDQFDSEGAARSGGWAPLADSTVRSKAREGLDSRILRATGDLYNSLTQRGNDLQVLHITHDSLVFGTQHPAGPFHQRGTSRMPQRRIIEFNEVDRRKYVKMIQRYVMTGKLL